MKQDTHTNPAPTPYVSFEVSSDAYYEWLKSTHRAPKPDSKNTKSDNGHQKNKPL